MMSRSALPARAAAEAKPARSECPQAARRVRWPRCHVPRRLAHLLQPPRLATTAADEAPGLVLGAEVLRQRGRGSTGATEASVAARRRAGRLRCCWALRAADARHMFRELLASCWILELLDERAPFVFGELAPVFLDQLRHRA